MPGPARGLLEDELGEQRSERGKTSRHGWVTEIW